MLDRKNLKIGDEVRITHKLVRKKQERRRFWERVEVDAGRQSSWFVVGVKQFSDGVMKGDYDGPFDNSGYDYYSTKKRFWVVEVRANTRQHSLYAKIEDTEMY